MSLLDAITALAPRDDGFAIDAPEAWSQGRTLYGGITTALLYEAVRQREADLGALRSAQVAFIGPASGRLTLRQDVLRRGRSATVVGADCRSEAGYAARAIFTFGAARASRIAHDHAPMPAVAPPEACEPFHNRGKPQGFPANFDMRLAAGARLFEPTKHPSFTLWARHLDDHGVDPVTSLLALADCPPPPAMVTFPDRGVISTMTWSIDLFHPFDSASDWRLLQSESEQAADGYSLQTMALWTAEGRRIAAMRQVVALFV